VTIVDQMAAKRITPPSILKYIGHLGQGQLEVRGSVRSGEFNVKGQGQGQVKGQGEVKMKVNVSVKVKVEVSQ